MTEVNQEATGVSEPEKIEEQKPARNKRPKSVSSGWISKLILFIVVVAVGGLSYYFFMTQKQLDEQLRLQQQTISQLEQNLRQFDETNDASRSELNARVQQLLQQSAQAEEVSQKAMEMISRNQRGWILAEMDYLLRVAHQRIEIAGDVKGAIAALRGADNRIAQLGDIRLMKIRKQLAQDIGVLNAIHQVDVNGIALAIDQVVMHLNELPFKSVVEEVQAQLKDETPPPVGPGQEKGFLDSVVDTVKQIGDIKVHPRSIEAASTSGQQKEIEQVLRTLLLSSRLAVLRHDQLQFQHDVQKSIELLNTYYNIKDNRVAQLLKDLQSYTELQLMPELPELTTAWDMLQQEIKREIVAEKKNTEDSQAQEAVQ